MRKLLYALTASAGLLLAPATQAADTLTLRYDGQQLAGEQLPPALRQSLYELALQYNQQRQQAVDQYVFNRYLQDEAQRQNKPLDQLQQELLAVDEPSPEQVRALYDANRERIQGSFDQVKDNIVQYLKTQQITQKQQQLMARIVTEKGYSLTLPTPPSPRYEIHTEGYPSQGKADAPVTLVEFADYQCPHCRNAAPVVKRLMERYGDQVRLVYMDYPINPSGISRRVAEAAVCADQQGQFWPFHDLAFERQQYLKSVTPDMLADELGLDRKAFDACVQTEATKTKVEASNLEARRLGVSGTPAFFINGQPLSSGQQGLEADLVEQIDAALKAS